jgi:hypothetical protein
MLHTKHLFPPDFISATCFWMARIRVGFYAVEKLQERRKDGRKRSLACMLQPFSHILDQIVIGQDFKSAINPAETDFNGPAARIEAAVFKIEKRGIEEGMSDMMSLTPPIQR